MRDCSHISRVEVQDDKDFRDLVKEVEPFEGLLRGPERMRMDLSILEELRTLKEVRKAKRLRETYAGTATMEVRQAKVFRLARTQVDSDPCEHGIDRSHEFQGVTVNLRKSVMPSQEGRGVRSSAHKVERAAMFNVRHAKGSGPRRGPRTQQVNQSELEAALALFEKRG